MGVFQQDEACPLRWGSSGWDQILLAINKLCAKLTDNLWAGGIMGADSPAPFLLKYGKGQP